MSAGRINRTVFRATYRSRENKEVFIDHLRLIVSRRKELYCAACLQNEDYPLFRGTLFKGHPEVYFQIFNL